MLGLMMARNVPLFAIAAAPILSIGARNVLFPAKRWQTIEANITALESRLRGSVLPIILGVGLALLIGVHYQVERDSLAHFDERIFPSAAADWLAQHPQSGNMFNEFNWGGYLLFRLWPGQMVFLDSQTDFYGEELIKEYDRAITAREGWQLVFEKYEIDWAILPASGRLTNELLDSGWIVIYKDDNAIIIKMPR